MTQARQAPYLFPAGARLGADNVILQARARRHHVESYAGPVSIKTVLAGQVTWMVGGRELVVDRSSFLILAAGEKYSLDIDAAQPVETCCAFFSPGFVERVGLDATSPVEQALDWPDRMAPALPYLSALHGDRERALVGHVQSLAYRCRRELAPSGFEEDFLLLAEKLLHFYRQIREQANRVPAMRASTRRELFRRLLVGREYIHSQSSGPLSLENDSAGGGRIPVPFPPGFHPSLPADAARIYHRLAAGPRPRDDCVRVAGTGCLSGSRLFESVCVQPVVPVALRGTAVCGAAQIRKIGQERERCFRHTDGMKYLFLFSLAWGMVLAQTPSPSLRVSMIALGVKDTARSIKFYGETLGLSQVGPAGEVTIFRAGDVTIVLNHPLGRAAGDAMVGAVELIFPVEKVSVTYHLLVVRGCRFLNPPREVTSGTWAATFTDPDGHRLTILGPQ